MKTTFVLYIIKSKCRYLSIYVYTSISQMSSPLLKTILLKGKRVDRKPIQEYRYQSKIKQLEQQIENLRDQLEESNTENKQLRALLSEGSHFSIPVQLSRSAPDSPPQFKLSM